MYKTLRKMFHRYAGRFVALVITLLLATSLWQLASAGWIQAKAVVAQQLLQQSWQQTLDDGRIHKPWRWADTWPVARLEVPALNIEQVVLAGDSGSSLAFGPGLSSASHLENGQGPILISGHRDTHFRFLQQLKTGDRLRLQTPSGTRYYTVNSFKIVDSRLFHLSVEYDTSLILSTCYPFEAIGSGGPLRYLVLANLSD